MTQTDANLVHDAREAVDACAATSFVRQALPVAGASCAYVSRLGSAAMLDAIARP